MTQKEAIVLVGVKETLTALKQFDTKAVSAFNKVVNEELRVAKFKAVALIPDKPMSGWNSNDQAERIAGKVPNWSASKAKAGIRLSKAERRVRGDFTTNAGAVIQGDASGAIFELAGRKSKGSGTGVKFIETLNVRFGKASRAVWKAVDSQRTDSERKVLEAFNKAKAELQKHLNSQKG